MAAALTALLNSFSLSDEPDHQSVLRACNDALRENKGNVDAQHTRVVALLKLDRFEDALREFETGGSRLKERAQVEYAYALYKSGRLEEAQKAAHTIDSRAGRHLEAQSAYRLEDFEKAGPLLSKLQQSDEGLENEENDLRINVSAVDAQLEWQRKEHLVSRRKPLREDLEVFETSFNAGCAAIARGDLPQAEMLLSRAKKLCQDLSLPEEEKQSELLPISVQQLFVFVLLNKEKEAQSLVQSLGIDTKPKSSIGQIAQINRLVAEKDSFNPYLSSRILKAQAQLPLSDQFFDYQNGLLAQNGVALEFLSGKFAGIASTTARTIQSQTGPTTSREVNAASSANAAAHAQLELGKAGIRSIKPLVTKRPEDLGLVATLVQLYVSVKNHGSAIQLVESLLTRLEKGGSDEELSVRYSPGLVAILVSLYKIDGRKEGIREQLAKAASYWHQKSQSPIGLLKAAGHTLIKSGREGDISEAKRIFTDLSGDFPQDRFIGTGLVASQASSDPVNAGKKAAAILPIEKLIAGIDVETLDKAGIPQAVSTATILSRKRAADAVKPAKKRLRKSRLPKDYDPDKKPDPERWLPLRDRKDYRPKKKKGKGRKAAQGGGAQGAIAADEPPSSQPVTVSGAGGGGGGGGSSNSRKKKKKGKR